jgi:hypothetical protein
MTSRWTNLNDEDEYMKATCIWFKMSKMSSVPWKRSILAFETSRDRRYSELEIFMVQ